MRKPALRYRACVEVEQLEDRLLLSGNPFSGSYTGTISGSIHVDPIPFLFDGGDFSGSVDVRFDIDDNGNVNVTDPSSFAPGASHLASVGLVHIES